MDRLDELEAQSIYIFREAFERLHKLALLWSLGKDSNVMIWLARKAFFGRVPFPVMHVDTGKKFPEMYAFRDRYSKEWDLDLIVEHCPPIEAVDPTLPPAARSAARKTEGLKLALAKHGFDGLFAGIRRDEEATPRQGACVLAARRRGTLGRARPAAGVLEPLQCVAAARGASSRASDPALDRKRHLAIHAARGHPHHPAVSVARRQALSLAWRRRHHLPDRVQRKLARRDHRRTRHHQGFPERSGRAMDHESEDAFERLRTAGYL